MAAASQAAEDERWMRRALQLARRGQGRVEPNPMVGCVIVRGNRLLGEGYHRRFGGPHAEVEALRRCRGWARGATAYVTLEPCCHFGKTGPCTRVLRAAGIARVVASMPDPFEQVSGKGFRELRRAGVRVDVGVGRTEAEQMNAPYLKLRREGIPWVIVKWAQSLDGRIATRSGDTRWISCEASRRRVHELRGRVDAVLVGVGTVLADDPELTCRMVQPKRLACRVVLDTRLRTPPDCRLVRTARAAPLLIASSYETVRRHSSRVARLHARGAEVVGFPCRGGRVDLKAVLRELGRRSFSNVLVEGGGEVIGALLDEALADEAYVFVSPRIIGGREAPAAVGGRGVDRLRAAWALDAVDVLTVGTDPLFHGRLRR